MYIFWLTFDGHWLTDGLPFFFFVIFFLHFFPHCLLEGARWTAMVHVPLGIKLISTAFYSFLCHVCAWRQRRWRWTETRQYSFTTPMFVLPGARGGSDRIPNQNETNPSEVCQTPKRELRRKVDHTYKDSSKKRRRIPVSLCRLWLSICPVQDGWHR